MVNSAYLSPRLDTNIFFRAGKARVLGELAVALSRVLMLIAFVSQNDCSDNEYAISHDVIHRLLTSMPAFDSHGTDWELRTRSEGSFGSARRSFDKDGR